MLQTIISNENYIFLAVFVVLGFVALLYLLSPMSLSGEPLVYLIGVDHAMQFKHPWSQMVGGEPEGVGKKREEFKAYVAEMIDKLGIEILAEEFSTRQAYAEGEVAFRRKVAAELEETAPEPLIWKTVLEQLGEDKGIAHRFCDPDAKEREALGIEVDSKKATESDWRKREQFWLSKIENCKHKRVLFVCGDNHYDTFAQLLESSGFNVQHGRRYDISDEVTKNPS